MMPTLQASKMHSFLSMQVCLIWINRRWGLSFLVKYVDDLREIITACEEQVLACMVKVKVREEEIEDLNEEMQQREKIID